MSDSGDPNRSASTNIAGIEMRDLVVDRDQGPIVVTRLFISIDALFSQYRRQLEVGPNERLAIEYLWEYGPMPMSELADRLAVTRAAVTTLVDRLAQSDVVHRLSDMGDRRRTIVSLTQNGLERCEEASRGWCNSMRGVLDKLSDKEWELVGAVLVDLHRVSRAEGDRARGRAGVDR